MAIDLLTDGDVVHELRHDLESFFWLLVWIILRHTTHTLDARACEKLFNHDDEGECQYAKTGFLTGARPLEVGIKPLDELIDEFRTACQTNFRVKGAEPSDPLTHEKVFGMFDKALAQESEWPTEDDEALPYVIPDDEEQIRQQRKRLTSNIESSRIDSGTPISIEGVDILTTDQILPSGSRRSRRLGSAARGGSSTQVTSGSCSRKRSREPHETTDEENDTNSDQERMKRTRTNSKRHGNASSGGRKQPKTRRGRK